MDDFTQEQGQEQGQRERFYWWECACGQKVRTNCEHQLTCGECGLEMSRCPVVVELGLVDGKGDLQGQLDRYVAALEVATAFLTAIVQCPDPLDDFGIRSKCEEKIARIAATLQGAR